VAGKGAPAAARSLQTSKIPAQHGQISLLGNTAKGYDTLESVVASVPRSEYRVASREYFLLGGLGMSLTIEMTAQEIALLKQITRLENDAEAVTKAAREFLRLSRLRELKAISGKVDFENNWQELEERELGTSSLI
jgi:hypothetical protein